MLQSGSNSNLPALTRNNPLKNQKIKEVCLMGGLGNQLFQFAFGRVISNYGRQPLRLDLSHTSLSRNSKLNSDLSEVMKDLNLDFVHRDLDRLASKVRNFGIRASTSDLITGNFKRYLSKTALELLFNFSFEEEDYRTRVLISNGLGDVEFNSEMSLSNIYAIGYFQSRNYFLQIIENDLKVRAIWEKFVASQSRRWSEFNPQNSAILHFRRGDYKKSRFGILSGSYYKSALATLSESFDVKAVYAISDDHDKQLLDDIKSIEKEITYIPTSGLSAAEILGLMAQFKGMIGANSSLSWWAASLGSLQSDNFAIFPARWFKYGVEPTNLMLEGWLTVDGDIWTDM